MMLDTSSCFWTRHHVTRHVILLLDMHYKPRCLSKLASYDVANLTSDRPTLSNASEPSLLELDSIT